MLKRIFFDQNGWQLENYFEYLRTIAKRVPGRLQGFICDERRYRLDSRESFHDAWLIFQTLHGPTESDANSVFKVELVFLGPWHDRYYKLGYLAAKEFEIKLNASNRPNRYTEYKGVLRRMDDLLAHEFDVSENGIFQHRLLFDSGLAISISCLDIEFEEKLI